VTLDVGGGPCGPGRAIVPIVTIGARGSICGAKVAGSPSILGLKKGAVSCELTHR